MTGDKQVEKRKGMRKKHRRSKEQNIHAGTQNESIKNSSKLEESLHKH